MGLLSGLWWNRGKKGINTTVNDVNICRLAFDASFCDLINKNERFNNSTLVVVKPSKLISFSYPFAHFMHTGT